MIRRYHWICYGLDGPGIESRGWGAGFSAPVQTGPGVHPSSCKMGTSSFPWVKRSGCGINYPSLSSAKVKERVELYVYSPSESSWPVLGWPLSLLLQYIWMHITLSLYYIAWQLNTWLSYCICPYHCIFQSNAVCVPYKCVCVHVCH